MRITIEEISNGYVISEGGGVYDKPIFFKAKKEVVRYIAERFKE